MSCRDMQLINGNPCNVSYDHTRSCIFCENQQTGEEMIKKALIILIPFLLIFLFGFFLLQRVQYQVPIVEVVDTFTRQEITGHPSAKRRSVAYAVVKIEFEGREHTVTVHDNTWKPLKAEDRVVVTRGLSGRLVEYRTTNAHRLMTFSAVMGPVCMLVFWVITKRNTSANRRKRAHWN